MNGRGKFVVISSLLLTDTVLLLGAYNATAQRKPIASLTSQAQARIIVTNTDLKPPVKIAAVKAKNRELERDKEFVDNDDWLRGLTIRLTNHSGKTVTFVGIELTFWRTEDQPAGLPAGWPLKKGLDPFGPEVLGEPPNIGPIPPGGDIEVVLSDQEYLEIKRFLKEVQFPDSIKKIKLEVMTIGFSDGSAWNTHRIYRRDPKNVKGPLKGWTP